MNTKYQPQIVIKPYKKKKKKKKIRKFLLGVLIIGLILSLSVYLLLSVMVRKELREIENLKKENKYFKGEIQKLSKSDIFYEEILRTKYGYIKKGEKIFLYSPYYYKIQKEKVK